MIKFPPAIVIYDLLTLVSNKVTTQHPYGHE